MPAWPMSSGAVVGVLRAIAKKHAETIGELIERMRFEHPIGVMAPAGCPMFHGTVGAARGRVPTRCKGPRWSLLTAGLFGIAWLPLSWRAACHMVGEFGRR
jgi:hypothetical protein